MSFALPGPQSVPVPGLVAPPPLPPRAVPAPPAGLPYGNDGVVRQVPTPTTASIGPPPVPAGGTRRPDGRIIDAQGRTIYTPPAATGAPPPPRPGGGPGIPSPGPAIPPEPAWATSQGLTPAQYGSWFTAHHPTGAPGGAAPPPGTPPPPPPGPGGPPPQVPPQAPGPPVFGVDYGGGYGPGGQYDTSGGGGGPADPSASGYGGPGQTGAYDDPFSQLLAAVPAMNLNATQQIAGAMGQAGFTGNRWSSSAENQAGQIGSQNAMAQNQMLTQAMSDYANKAQDRSLSAAQGSTALGGLLDQMAQNRITTPAALAQYEQGRQDNFSNEALQQFNSDKLGWFPYLLQAATSQGAGSPGQIVPTTTPGTPGALDYAQGIGGLASLLGGLFGGSGSGGS